MKLWILSALYTLAGAAVVSGLIYLLTLAPHWFILGLLTTIVVGLVGLVLTIATWATQEFIAERTDWHPAWCWVLSVLIVLGGIAVFVGAMILSVHLSFWAWMTGFGAVGLFCITLMVRERLVRRSR